LKIPTIIRNAAGEEAQRTVFPIYEIRNGNFGMNPGGSRGTIVYETSMRKLRALKRN
jgi:hypothetical protein